MPRFTQTVRHLTQPEAVPLYHAFLCGFISLTHLGRVPLHRVSQGGHWQRVMAKSSLEIARLVISGADVNAADIEGCAPPHVTA
jgi:hypothetical protein